MKQSVKSSSEIEEILKSQFGIEPYVQVIPMKGEKRTLYQLERIPFTSRMTLGGMERFCQKIAKALNAELYGTVNMDFTSLCGSNTFDLLLEVL